MGGGPIPGNPLALSKTLEYSSYSLAYEITQPIKTNLVFRDHAHFLRGRSALEQLLTFSDSPYSVYRVCISLNKSAFTLPWPTLEFFPAQSQGLSLGGLSHLSHRRPGTYILSRPIFPTLSHSPSFLPCLLPSQLQAK